MAGPNGLRQVILGGFLIAGGSVLGWAGCAQPDVPVTAEGAPIVDFRALERTERCTGTGAARVCRVAWTGDVIIADQIAARGLSYLGDDIGEPGQTVRAAWVPATLTLTPIGDTGNGQWWFVGAAVLILAGAVLEEQGRRKMRHGGIAT